MSRKSLSELSFSDAPKIIAGPPVPKSRVLLDKQIELECGAVSYPRGTPVAFEQGRGATIRDVDGNVFIDFFGGAGVLNVGHCNPDVVEAVRNQVGKLTHTLDFPTSARAEMGRRSTGGALVTFGNRARAIQYRTLVAAPLRP